MPLMKSWVQSANEINHPFPLNNLPYCVFKDSRNILSCGVGIGHMILNITHAEAQNLITLGNKPLFHDGNWLNLCHEPRSIWSEFRRQITHLLKAESPHQSAVETCLVPQSSVTLDKPFMLREYTDFYSGRHHAENVGRILRGTQGALPPNWLHIPIGYCGRQSSVAVSPDTVRRPWGQIMMPNDTEPTYVPSRKFDFELEIGAVVGKGTERPVSVKDADDMILGYVLLNDWSARDIQAWEYQPLGPFLAKATRTTISPWIITKEALEPFRVHTPAREKPLLPHLKDDGPMLYDIDLSVALMTTDKSSTTITRTNYKEMYFSSAQQVTHLASSGCTVNPGDLLGSGTISGPRKQERGSLLELTWGGQKPLKLESGHMRTFLEDGDTITFHGHAQGDGYRIGFGECSGTILPAFRDPIT